jgi:type II secretory pathway pseudopilin PulG
MSHTDAPGATPADAPVEAVTEPTAGRRRPRVPAQRGPNGAAAKAAAANGAAPATPAAVDMPIVGTGLSDTGEFRLPPRSPDDTGTDLMLYVPPAYLNIGPPIPPKSSRGGFIGVIALIVVLALISALATVAYFVKSSAYDRQAAQLRDQRAATAAQQAATQDQQNAASAKDNQIATLTAQLATATQQLDTLRTNATGDASKLQDLAKAQAALAACISADKSWIYLLRIKAGASSLNKAQTKANKACTAANKYMP